MILSKKLIYELSKHFYNNVVFIFRLLMADSTFVTMTTSGPWYDHDDCQDGFARDQTPYKYSSFKHLAQSFPDVTILSVTERYPPTVQFAIPRDQVEHIKTELKASGFIV